MCGKFNQAKARHPPRQTRDLAKVSIRKTTRKNETKHYRYQTTFEAAGQGCSTSIKSIALERLLYRMNQM